MSAATVRPLRPRDVGWDPDVVEAPEVYPHVTPRTYIAITRAVNVLPMYNGRRVRLLVDLHDALEQPPLAQGVPWFMPVPRRSRSRAAATSNLVRLFQLLGLPIPKRGPLPLTALLNKALSVQVGDCTESRDREPDPADPKRKIPVPLPPPLFYSVVRRPLERLA